MLDGLLISNQKQHRQLNDQQNNNNQEAKIRKKQLYGYFKRQTEATNDREKW